MGFKLDKKEFKEKLEGILLSKYGKKVEEASEVEIYNALGQTIMDEIAENWYETDKLYEEGKQAYYLSAEFLMGRALGNNLINLGILNGIKEILAEYGIDYNKIENAEDEAGLGNGGLGRLAACFLDSLVTQNLPGHGYGIRYRNGIFKQKFENGFQKEYPDTWLKYGSVWSVERPSDEVIVEFGDHSVRAIPFDMPIIGYGTKNINTLRLWEARSIEDIDLDAFNAQEYDKAVLDRNRAEDISRILYPNDSTDEGKKLRLKQEYFFVSASLQDILKKFKYRYGKDFQKFPEYVAIQMNDTHPALAVPEMMRLLWDVEGLSWHEAWDIVVRTFSYTNHTILAEAMEKWETRLFQQVLPRMCKIIQRINVELHQFLEQKYPDDRARQERMSIIQNNVIYMAWLAIYGSHAVNGVAAMHTEILKRDALRDWYELSPEKFQNKTNGITQRRWLLASNPQLSAYITELIGNGWITNLSELKKLEAFADNPEVLEKFMEIKQKKKRELAKFIKETRGIDINPDSIFDVQIKRLHEYKRQFMNILKVMDLYNKIKENPEMKLHPITFIFGAKAAAGYRRAKGVIKLINEVANRINNDETIGEKIKVAFIENYDVSTAQKLFPAADVSEQISTAGKEASGTGNMKFMLNGAITLGTLDGANVEIVEEAGYDNNVIFGLRCEEVEELKRKGYNPWIPYENTEGLKRVVDSLVDGTWDDNGTGLFRELHNSLIYGDGWGTPDQYFVLEDFKSYREAQMKINEMYKDRIGWAKKGWINIANSGKFSSDRTIKEYAEEIWNIKESVL
jgi:starch phosphorylase